MSHSARSPRRSTRAARRSVRSLFASSLAVLVLATMTSGLLGVTAALASSVSSAVFTGGAGTFTVGGTLYAKQFVALTLTVTTSSDTQCVDVAGAFTGHQSGTAKSSWTFTTTAPAGNGAQAVNTTASKGFNGNGCTGASGSLQASYVLDNTGPAVTAGLSPAANAAGWNNANTTITWSATDVGGSGVASGPTPASSTESSNGIVTRTSTATDRVGNVGNGSVTVRIDKAAPSITASETKNGDGTSTFTFTCTDSNSGIKICPSPVTLSPQQSGTYTTTDNADNVSAPITVTNNFVSDNTPPTISHSVAPAPNAAGWNKADATVTFTCADNTGGSGMASCLADGTTSASRTISSETNGTVVSGTATDNAGNKATDSTTVKLDKTAPTITATRTPAANANGWNNTSVTVTFTCSDGLSGIKTCPSPVVLSADGANQSASGTATDNAGNTSTVASVTGINIDKTAPSLTGAPTTSANSNGWYNGDVAIKWTASDGGSGLAGAVPANSTLTGEGTGQTASASISDRAGNTTNAVSAAVNIDRSAPTTGISGTSNVWTNGTVTVTLSPSDSLSGVASTSYAIDGGATQSGTSFDLSAEGDHTVTYFSTDRAGNVEAAQTAHVRIDKTAPTIGHTFTPLSYTDGAWINSNVTVTFECTDSGSGIASCTSPVTKSTEGEGQQVNGTATDNAGNSASDLAVVSIDKTAPTISAAADRAPNAAGWYNDDVTVSYTANDALSGVDTVSPSKTLGEGANQSATGTATDAARNSASDGVTGINIDKTDPVLTGTFTPGWHTGDVTVNWTCTDALSGPAAQPADSTVTGEGANLSATATCTDKAGNTTTKSISGIQIDRTSPATSVAVSGPLNNGWYTAGTSVTLTASDNLSGVASTVYSIDGGTAKPYTAAVSIAADGTHTFTYWSTDTAGNVEDKTGNSVTLKIDKTAPILTGAVATQPNANGWYSGDVTVNWTCSDATSGIDGACPADSIVGGEGGNLGAAASVSDLAGNSTKATVSGIKIDRTDPTTTAEVAAPLTSGWYGDAVQVTLTGSDNLSGVDNTFYAVDGGAAQTYIGAFSFGTQGTHTIAFWSKDNAGNVETAGAPLTLKIDTTPPTTTVINPISPDSGWFVTSGIPVAFDANDAVSGIKATYYTIDGGAIQTYGQPFTADLSTGTHTITYWSVDLADNVEAHATTNTIAVNVDTDAPTISGAATPAPNSFGWNNTNVDVKFTCADVGSGLQTGVAGCAGDTTLTNDGAGQMVHGDAVDVAGNKSSTDFGPVNIDTVKPTLSGAPTTDANGAGWYKGDVTIAWTGVDKLSGINSATQPANSTVNGEGRNLGAGSVTIADKAGNVSDATSVTGINIDRVAPTVTGVLPTGKNAAGWYSGDVVVGFTCADPALADGSAGSGVASCPSDQVVKGDGANQSVTSVPAMDVAGNASAPKTVSGINVDGHAAQTTADNKCTATNGYCKGSTATVVLTSVDVGPSGVKEIHYTVNGGAEQVATGATATLSIPTDGTGHATFTYYAVDNAGNVEPTNTGALDYDNIAPTVTHTVSPVANAAGWNKSTTTVHFSAKDTDPGSGVDPTTITPDVTISSETTTSGTVVSGSASDTAGNLGTDSVTIRLDKTAPSISGAIVPGTTMVNGWYTGTVKVHFTCSDALSGIAVCPDDMTVTSNGTNQSVTRSATDVAGNTSSATVSGITIDNENPTVTSVNVANGLYTLGAVPTATCTATDSFSGVASCKVTVTGGTVNGVGTFTYTAIATDKAGNVSAPLTGTYAVAYRFDGFLQPINDTAHQVGLSTSIFKGGSTVPVKFQLRSANGTIVQSATAPVWLTPVKGVSMSVPVDESVYTASPDSGTTYRWDGSQYIYNWKTGTGGNYWRIGVRLDDCQTYYVNIGLR